MFSFAFLGVLAFVAYMELPAQRIEAVVVFIHWSLIVLVATEVLVLVVSALVVVTLKSTLVVIGIVSSLKIALEITTLIVVLMVSKTVWTILPSSISSITAKA